MRKIIIILILFIGLAVNAADNFLNSVVISDNNTSIILRTDKTAKIKKEIESSDKVVLTLKGVQRAFDINTLYKNTPFVNSLIIQNDNNDIKIYIEAPHIASADIIFETPNSAPITAFNGIARGKSIWAAVSVLLLLLIMYKTRKNLSENQPKKDYNQIIKEREMNLYRNFQQEVKTLPSMNYKLKSYRKHVLKGETIRSYENRMSKV